MTSEDEDRARQLFFEYDGSEFYMSRDGTDEEFRALKVPRAKRRESMKELTAQHLADLPSPGNWKSLNFLSHHWDYSHVRQALSTPPLGVWWEQVAYLEFLLDYVGKARYRLRATPADLRAAADMVVRYGEPLRRRVRTADKQARMDRLLDKARQGAEAPSRGA